jgi:Fe-S cluster biogenesis protein NfuA
MEGSRTDGGEVRAALNRGVTMDDQASTVATGDGAVPAGTSDAITDAERAERLGALRSLIELMRPSVQADGGDLILVSADVESGVVGVQLQGSCSSCAISSSTLQGGVERILRDRLPWVTEVVGELDDSLDAFESAALGQGGYVPGY